MLSQNKTSNGLLQLAWYNVNNTKEAYSFRQNETSLTLSKSVMFYGKCLCMLVHVGNELSAEASILHIPMLSIYFAYLDLV